MFSNKTRIMSNDFIKSIRKMLQLKILFVWIVMWKHMELEGFVTKWTLSLTQPYKTGLIRWGLHPLIYNERL